MFFDLIILKHQHKGQFGKAWLAATRGVNTIPKDEIAKINISKLCEHLTNYIVSESTSPTKRFSLRLSAILVNGTIRILKRQVDILEAEVLSTLQPQLSHFTSDIRLSAYARRILNSPQTPIATVKGKKRNKKHVETTPPSQIEAEILRIQLDKPSTIPNIDDVLAIQPTSDLITLREAAPRQPLVEDLDNFGLQAPLTDEALLEMGVEPFVSRLPQIPVTSPSSEATHPQVIQVVAEVHAETESSNIPAQPLEEAVQGRRQVVEPLEEAVQARRQVVEPLVEAVQTRRQVVEPLEEAVQAPRQDDEPVLRELPLEDNVTRERQVRRRISDELSETAVKKAAYKNKIFTKSVGRRFLPINRPYENETTFLLKGYHFVISNIKLKQSAIQYESYKDSVLLQPDVLRESTHSSHGQISHSLPKRSTIETLIRPEETLRSGDSHGSSQLGDITTIPPLIFGTPIEQPLPVPEQITQIPVQPTELDDLPESIPFQTLDLPVSTRLRESQTSTPLVYRPIEEHSIRIPELAAHYKERQQRIIDIVMKWNFDDRILKITDVSEKPINKLNITRAFHDLLVLSASKHLILYTEEDTIELKEIKKGPKLL